MTAKPKWIRAGGRQDAQAQSESTGRSGNAPASSEGEAQDVDRPTERDHARQEQAESYGRARCQPAEVLGTGVKENNECGAGQLIEQVSPANRAVGFPDGKWRSLQPPQPPRRSLEPMQSALHYAGNLDDAQRWS